MPNVSVDPLPPYKTYGRYVCDWACTEAHIFDTGKEAKNFAKHWHKDCNVGWLPPIYENGRNRKPRIHECVRMIARNIYLIDHRKETKNG